MTLSGTISLWISQVLVIGEQAERGFGDAADAGLDHGPIGDQRGHVARDGAVQIGDFVHADIRPAGARFR